jgi:hypothetical protein
MNGRLTVFEKLAKQAGVETAAQGIARRQLVQSLVTTADKLRGHEPTEDWCAKVSMRDIAAMGMLEVEEGKNTAVLWDVINVQTRIDGPVGRLFTALEAMADGP